MSGLTEIVTQKQVRMQIPFSPPYIDEDVIAEVTETLRSGWITTGPKVKALEVICEDLTGCKVICVNSWTSGAALSLKWLGVQDGDEVIIPAYTYAATALSILNAGAKPVLVDISDDFTINIDNILKAITPRTKAVMVVDIGGIPCHYNEINAILKSAAVKKIFKAANGVQSTFGRPVLIADAAHSLGAGYNGKSAAQAADITIYSLHAVKNITTAEGGLVCLNLPEPFDNADVQHWMKLNSLNGQTKDAFTKTKTGTWRYDIVSAGLKINMPDVCAAIGLAQLRKYPSLLLPERERIFRYYSSQLASKEWAILPVREDSLRKSSCHLFMLRIKGISEVQRNSIMSRMSDAGVSTNVHFIPLPMLTLFKDMGYKMEDYPDTYEMYANEISLPIYPDLTTEQCDYVIEQLEEAYNIVK